MKNKTQKKIHMYKYIYYIAYNIHIYYKYIYYISDIYTYIYIIYLRYIYMIPVFGNLGDLSINKCLVDLLYRDWESRF